MVSSILSLSAVSFFTSIFLSLSFFLSSLASSFSLFLFYFSLNKSLHVVHANINGNFSVLLLYLHLGVFGHCKTLWRGEMCSPLSLFSDPVCMFVLVPEFSSRVL
jgi:hypothetical protein